jgi:branched-chain amino acid transport system permease protein
MLNYLVAMLTFAGLYALMAMGLNVVWGMAGMINLGLVGFFALGAYASGLGTLRLGLPLWAGPVAAAALAAAAGAVMALVTARLRGDYLAIVTLGFAEIVRLVAANEIWLTNGTDGLSGIPGPLRGRVSPETFNLVFLGITIAAVALCLLVTERLRHSPFGRVLRAIRDDDQVAAVAGKPVLRFKVQAFAVGAAVIGFAGALYGQYTSYVAPDVFVPLITIYIVLALAAGGTGNNRGAVLGAVLVVFFMEGTRFVAPLLSALRPVQVAALREFLISVSLILVLRFRPEGLIPERLPPIQEPRP